MRPQPRVEPAIACPVCATPDPRISVKRDVLPSMQNYVHRTIESARNAARGPLLLSTCGTCGFSWNTAFDPSQLNYDAGYDNAVPSAVMNQHYENTARDLGRRHDLSRGPVVDIGCGRATFLDTLCRIWPSCHARGVDPALPHDAVLAGGRLTLIKGVFTPDLLADTPSLIVCRHVLEHVPDPVGFVRQIREACGTEPAAPLFVEVPDLTWMIAHGAFWDFCYEHCNYFTASTLASVLQRAGFTPTASGSTFGQQYLWMEALPTPAGVEPPAPEALPLHDLDAYASDEAARMSAIRDRLVTLRGSGRTVVVWGMATKGVLFSLLVDPESRIIDFAVDSNRNKQGCFVPVSGRRIDAPRALQRPSRGPMVIVVMNRNYLDEIAERCRTLRLTASFLDAAGNELGTT